MHTVFNAFEAQLNTTGTFCMYLLLNTLKLGSMPLFHFTGSTLWAQLYPPTLFVAFFGLLITFDRVLRPPCWHCRRLLALSFIRFPGVTAHMRYDWCEVWINWGMIGARYESFWQLWGMNCMIVATCWRMIALVVDACCPFPPPDELDFVWQAQCCSHRHLSSICK